jgi:hypothetical protein
MDDRMAPFARRGGVALTRDLIAVGYDADELHRLVRRGEIVRLRRGAYVAAPLWLAADDRAKHLLRAQAVAAQLQPPAVLSHVSAAVALGLPVWGVSLDTVHVTRPRRGQTRHEAGVTHHAGALWPEHVANVDGLPVTRADRTVVDLARLAGFEGGVVTADAALHLGMTTHADLREVALLTADWPASRVSNRVVAFADGLAESVGESRSRVLCDREGLPAPELQVEIRAGGQLLGRVDLLLRRARTVIEFDGRVKYRLGGGQDMRTIEQTLWQEKIREDRIRAEGYRFVRLVWADLDQSRATGQRIRRVMAQEPELQRRRPA